MRSHASGLGNPLSEEETRAMMLLRANVLARGNSGCRVLLVETLLAMLERRVHPVIPEKGSVGASGDLAPLAHLALSMIGEGESWFGGLADLRRRSSARSRHRARAPAKPRKGWRCSTAPKPWERSADWRCFGRSVSAALADLAGAMTLEALLGTPVAFDARIHQRPSASPDRSKPRPTCVSCWTAARSAQSHLTDDPRVQDAYSLRCMPQVHGAVRNALRHARETVEIESGSATDNPLVFAEEGDVLSGGNFHGAPLAMVFDYAAIAMTDLMSIGERRIDRLVNPDLNEGLPPFLSPQPGLSSGYMIAHIAAAALLNEAKVLAHPAVVDNVPTSGGKEDHVSMGMTSALKLRQIVDNAEQVLAIELMAACDGLEYRAPLRSSPRIEQARQRIRIVCGSVEG